MVRMIAFSSRGVLARNSAASLLALVMRLASQAVYFVALARTMQPAGYGAFVAVTGLVGVAAPFAAWGAGDLLVQRVAREGVPFPRAWGEALRTIAVGGLGFGAIVLTIARLVLPVQVPLALVAAVAVAEFWGASVVTAGAQAFQAHERLGRSGAAWVLLSLLRMSSALLLAGCVRAGLVQPTPAHWGLLYLASTGVAAVVVVRRVHAELGRPAAADACRAPELRAGFFYAVSLAAASIYNDIDKLMLARLGTLGATGVYGAGYRMVEMSFSPITALLVASYARFFQHGAAGVRGSLRLARRMLPIAACHAAAAALALFVLAPVMVHVLSPEYHEVAAVVRGLALLPVVRAVQYFAANTLTGAGQQGARSACQLLTAVVNVLLNLWLIPAHGWHGAVWATLAAEGLLAALLWTMTAVYVGRETRADRATRCVARSATLLGVAKAG
jgi:O-antigen/teichoic acid export membrane protein